MGGSHNIIPTKISTHRVLSLHTQCKYPPYLLHLSDDMAHLWLAIIFRNTGTMRCRRFDNLESAAWGNRVNARLWYCNSRSTHNLYPSHKLYQAGNCCKLHPPPSPLTFLRVRFLRGLFFPSKTILTSLLAPLFPVPMVFSMSEVMKRDMRSLLAHDACRISHVRL